MISENSKGLIIDKKLLQDSQIGQTSKRIFEFLNL